MVKQRCPGPLGCMPAHCLTLIWWLLPCSHSTPCSVTLTHCSTRSPLLHSLPRDTSALPKQANSGCRQVAGQRSVYKQLPP